MIGDEPVDPELLDSQAELLEIDGLGEEVSMTTGMEAIRGSAFGFLSTCTPSSLGSFKSSRNRQGIQPIFLGHQQGESLDAVARHPAVVGHMVPAQSVEGQLHVAGLSSTRRISTVGFPTPRSLPPQSNGRKPQLGQRVDHRRRGSPVVRSPEMIDFIVGQLDYIFFVAAFALIIAGAECLVLADDKSERSGWILLTGFLLLQGFALMANASTSAFHHLAARGLAAAALNAASFVFLAGFALSASSFSVPRLAARLAPWALVGGFAAVAAVFGDRALDTAAWFVGAPMAALAAMALLPRIRTRGPGWRALAAFAVCLALVCLLAAAAGLASILRPQWDPLPLQLGLVLLSIHIGVSLPAHDLALIRARMRGLHRPIAPAFTVLMLSLFPLMLCMGWGLTEVLGQQGRKLLRQEADTEAQVYTSTISAQTQETDRIARMLTDSPALGLFLASPDASLRAQVESDLDRHSGVLPSTVCYILNAAGTVVASSNRREKDSFEGENYESRPYVAEAMAGLQGRYFALQVTSGRRGYYASAPVRGRDGQVLGIGAIEQDVERLQSTLGSAAVYFLIDPDGIVFMSAERDSSPRTLWPLAQTSQDVLERSHQFGPVSVDPVLAREPIDGGTASLHGEGYLVARHPLSPPGWSVVLLRPLRLVTLYRLAGIFVTLVVSIVLLGLSVVGKLTVLSSAKIAQSQSLYKGLVEALPDWVSIVDGTGTCLFSNSAGLRALGRSEAELRGRTTEGIFGSEQVQLIARGKSEAYANGKAFFETTVVGADGARRTWSFTVVPLAEGGQQEEIMLIGADVTDSRATAERLIRAERMAALGSLAAGIAHQFNNINTVALGYLQILQGAEAGIPDRSRDYLAAVREAIERSVGITSRLLALGSMPSDAGQSCRLGDAVRSAAEMLKPALEAEGILLALDLADEHPVALARRHIDFILSELLSNGRHALIDRARRELWIETGQTRERAFLRVRDTGIGIGQEDLRGIFTPFHSLKGEHAPPGSPQAKVKGVGLSLAIVDSIVKGRGGRIEAESRLGEGSVFTVWLPREAEKS